MIRAPFDVKARFAKVHGLKYKNVAAELLAKLLGDEIKVRSKRNLVQSREFSEMLKKTLNAYHNRAIATQEVIEEPGKCRMTNSDCRTDSTSNFALLRSHFPCVPSKPWAKTN